MDGMIIQTGAPLIQTTIIQCINVLILIFALSKFLFKPITEFMTRRNNEILDRIKLSEQLQEDAQNLKNLYEEKIRQVNIEAEKIIGQAKIYAREQERKIIEDARIKSNLIITNARENVDRELQMAQESIKKQIGETATIIAQKIIDVNLDYNKHHEILNQNIQKLGALKWTQ